MKTKNVFFLFLILFSLNSCDCFLGLGSGCDDEIDLESENPESDAIIYAEFSNDGNIQNLIIDKTKTVGPVQIENDAELTKTSTRYKFEFSGVTFTKDKEVFEVENIISQRFQEGEWKPDSENKLNYERSKSLDIVLVLDVSSSLGSNISAIKNSANTVLDQIFNSNKNTKVAIIKFSRGNVIKSLSSNKTELRQFISQNTQYTDNVLGGGTYNLENQDETALYEAMLEGINVLNSSDARGQGLITFTDGSHNFQFDINNSNRQIVINELNKSKISSYTIGFVGNADEVNDNALSELAVNGVFSKPNSIVELDKVFTLFSNSIGAVFDLTYDANNSPFPNSRPYRFLFDLKKVN